jgi:uncharacterized membrane protein HdeD (DUF308 family)
MSEAKSRLFAFDSSRMSSGQINGIRVALVVSGLVAILVGILILAQPGVVLTVVGWLFGLFFIVTGVLRVGRSVGVRNENAGLRWISGILGVLLVAAGIVILLNPGFGVEVLAMVIGIAWIIEGAAALAAFAPDSSRWLGVLYGVLSIVAGALVLILPSLAVDVFLLVAAIMLIAAGAVQLVQAIFFGRKAKRAAAAATA